MTHPRDPLPSRRRAVAERAPRSDDNQERERSDRKGGATQIMSIGEVADRTGIATSALRTSVPRTFLARYASTVKP